MKCKHTDVRGNGGQGIFFPSTITDSTNIITSAVKYDGLILNWEKKNFVKVSPEMKMYT